MDYVQFFYLAFCWDTYYEWDCYLNSLVVVGGELTKGVNTVPEAVPVWPAVQYISDTGQYRCTVLGLPQFFIFINKYIYIYIYMYVCMYVCMCVCVYINKYKSLS